MSAVESKTHYLKIEPRWFDRVATSVKRAEIRKHDRDYQVGDHIVLVAVDDVYALQNRDVKTLLDPERGYDASTVTVQILHVLPAHLAVGLEDGYVLLSIEVVS